MPWIYAMQEILQQQEKISKEAVMYERLKVKEVKISDRAKTVEILESFEEIKKSAINLHLKHTV